MIRTACLVLGLVGLTNALATPWILPTANRSLYSGNYPDFYMYVPRIWEGQSYNVWQGGKYGFVRSPVKSLGEVLYMRFHEGVDIRPTRRDASGNPLDLVWSAAPGVVVHVNPVTRHSSYGKYVVVEHSCDDGRYYSLYAHLKRALVEIGQPVRAGSTLGELGYTGPGLNRERAHLHFEINLVLDQQFDAWYAITEPTGNPHGIYNGLNLAGIPVADYLLAQRASPGLTIQDFLTKQSTYYRVTVPKVGSRMDILREYRWLLKENAADTNAWEIAFSGSGVPLAIRGAETTSSGPELIWVDPSPHPHTYKTRKRLTGSKDNARLTGSGKRYVNLVTGRTPIPKPPPPVEAKGD